MQRLFTVLYCACILLQIVYGTITGRKGTSTENEEKILMSGVHPSVVSYYFTIEFFLLLAFSLWNHL